MEKRGISKAATLRMPLYLRYLQWAFAQGERYVSSEKLAQSILVSAVLVRKDLARVTSTSGTPRLGFEVQQLMKDIEKFLGYDNLSDVIIVGVGGLGKAFLSYEGFKNNGLNIVAAFDIDPKITGKKIAGKTVYDMSDLERYVNRKHVNLAIITVPKTSAQEVLDRLVKAGIRGVWNFAPTALIAPPDVVVKNEDLSSSLALLSNELANRSI